MSIYCNGNINEKQILCCTMGSFTQLATPAALNPHPRDRCVLSQNEVRYQHPFHSLKAHNPLCSTAPSPSLCFSPWFSLFFITRSFDLFLIHFLHKGAFLILYIFCTYSL